MLIDRYIGLMERYLLEADFTAEFNHEAGLDCAFRQAQRVAQSLL
jgi:hypothetical protein